MTILENFELMMPGKGEEEYLAYSALVNMDAEIRQMPEGLHTPINSDRISSGQRQRLSLCMILMRETPLILLDEPTANLDKENSLIVKSLFRNFPQKRFFVVSHGHEIFDDSSRIYKIYGGNYSQRQKFSFCR